MLFFYVLSWKLPQKMFIHERLLVSTAWGVAMILIYMSSGLPVLPFVWVGALLLLGLLFRFMRSAAQQRPMS